MGPVINCAIYEGGLKIRDLDINNPEDMKVQSGRVICGRGYSGSGVPLSA